MNKLQVKEAIIVEGRDDVDAVSKACDALIIATHGFGITKETWKLIDKAAREKGLLILTDPDFSGEEIRRRITAEYPDAKQAYLPRSKALKKGDIGVENAAPEAIREVLEQAAALDTARSEKQADGSRPEPLSGRDLCELGLDGTPGSKGLRILVGAALGIGYGNAKTFRKKINYFGIDKDSIKEIIESIEQQEKEKQQ